MQQTYSNIKDNQSICIYQGSITDTAVTPIYIWNKPKDCQLIYIYCVGGGGGGGGGNCAAKPANKIFEGGRGGRPGASFVGLYPANTLPDILYVSPGYGGSGAPGGAYGLGIFGPAAAGGGASIVTLAAPINNYFETYWNAIAYAAGGSGGGNGASQTGFFNSKFLMSGGSSNSILDTGDTYVIPDGVKSKKLPMVGTVSAGYSGVSTYIYEVSNTTDTTVNFSFLPNPLYGAKNVLCTPGLFGGYAVSDSTITPSSFPGGSITLENTILSSLYSQFSGGTIPGGSSGLSGSAGSNGIGYGLDLTNINYINTLNLYHPLFFTGGAGGGGAHGSTGNGGDGGHGGPGCGGGGGGGSCALSSPYRGGNGGNGGPGFIIIIAI